MAETLTEWPDPSITDERDPDRRDPALDMYAPACPAQPPFSAAFVAAFRTAQIARNRRISAWAQTLLSRLRNRPDGDIERASVVHRTMCDVLCTMCDVLCTMCDVLCTMCDVLCTMFDVRCTMRRALHDVRRALAQPPPSIGTAVDQAGPIGATRVWSILARSGRPAAPHSGHGCHIGPTTSAAPADQRAPVLQLINQADDAVPASHAPEHARGAGAAKELYRD